jgi:hypothetical protein
LYDTTTASHTNICKCYFAIEQAKRERGRIEIRQIVRQEASQYFEEYPFEHVDELQEAAYSRATNVPINYELATAMCSVHRSTNDVNVTNDSIYSVK